MLVAAGVAFLLAGNREVNFSRQASGLTSLLVVLSFVVECTGLLIAVPLWRRILTYYGIHQRWQDDLRLYCYSALGAVLPGSIWTIAGRSVLYQRLGCSRARVAAAGVIEALLIGVAASGVYGATSIFYSGMSFWRQPVLGALVLLLTLVLLHPMVFNRLASEVVARTGQTQKQAIPSFRLRHLVVWVLLDALMVIIGGTALFILLLSFIEVRMDMWAGVVAAWAAASVAGNLLFWLPGTAIFRDGVLVLAAAESELAFGRAVCCAGTGLVGHLSVDCRCTALACTRLSPTRSPTNQKFYGVIARQSLF